MFAVSSGDIYSIVACLNAGCNPFLENGLHEDAKAMAKQFPNRKGQDFEKYIDQAKEQWQSRVNPEVLK